MTGPLSSSGAPDQFGNSVFVNCPFDDAYKELLRPLLFVIIYFGHTPRLASERSDSGENRLNKISGLIASCQFSIHDLSRIKSKTADEFYRMNMPFELGIDFGTRLHWPEYALTKRFLILEKKPHDLKIALSDLAGIDIKPHADEPEEICRALRDWYYETVGVDASKPRKHHWISTVWANFLKFVSFLFDERLDHGLSQDEAAKDIERMPVAEFIDSAQHWVDQNVVPE